MGWGLWQNVTSSSLSSRNFGSATVTIPTCEAEALPYQRDDQPCLIDIHGISLVVLLVPSTPCDVLCVCLLVVVHLCVPVYACLCGRCGGGGGGGQDVSTARGMAPTQDEGPWTAPPTPHPLPPAISPPQAPLLWFGRRLWVWWSCVVVPGSPTA